MIGRRRAVAAGLILTAPLAFLGLVLLPVGLLLQIGTQSSLRIENRSDRRVLVTPLGTRSRDGRRAVLPQAVSNLVPLPAFRGVDLPLLPGASRTVVYKRGDLKPSGIAVHDFSEGLYHVPCSGAGPVAIGNLAELPLAGPEVADLVASSPQAARWTVVASGVLGLSAFLQLLRLRRRWVNGAA